MQNVISIDSFIAQRIAARHFLLMNHWIAHFIDRSKVVRKNMASTQPQILAQCSNYITISSND